MKNDGALSTRAMNKSTEGTVKEEKKTSKDSDLKKDII